MALLCGCYSARRTPTGPPEITRHRTTVMRSLFTERHLKHLLATPPAAELSIPDPTLPRFGLRLKPSRGPGTFAATWTLRYTFNGQKRRYSVGDARAKEYQARGKSPRATPPISRVDNGVDVAAEKSTRPGGLRSRRHGTSISHPRNSKPVRRGRKPRSVTTAGCISFPNSARSPLPTSPRATRARSSRSFSRAKGQEQEGQVVSAAARGLRAKRSALVGVHGLVRGYGGVIELNPLYRAVKLRADGHRQQCWTPDEYKRFLRRAKAKGTGRQGARVVADAIRLLVFTGMRRSEVLNLTWPKCD